MRFDGLKCYKIPHGTSDHELPTEDEILQFKKAIARAAFNDAKIAARLAKEPKLQIPDRVRDSGDP